MLRIQILIFLICLALVDVSAQRSHGLKADDSQYRSVTEKPRLMAPRREGFPPDSASLKKYTPKPLSQRMENTGPGYAAAYGALTMLQAREYGITDQLELRKSSFSPTFNYFLSKDQEETSCSALVRMPDILESMKEHGTPFYKDFPKSCPTSIPDHIFAKAYANRIADYCKVFDQDAAAATKIQAIKEAVANGSPVIVGWKVTSSFERVMDEFWQPREQATPNSPVQALLIVGYNDFKYTGAFQVMNSWGSEWGVDGYMWVRYKDFDEYALYGFEIFKMPSTENLGSASTTYNAGVHIKSLAGEPVSVSLENAQDGFYRGTLIGEDLYRIEIQSDFPSYIYAIASDSSEEIFDLNPDNKTPINPYPDYRFVFDLEFDESPGSSYLAFLFSQQPLAFEDIERRMNLFKGKGFNDRFHLSFYEKLYRPDNVNFSPTRLNFESNLVGIDRDRSVIGIIVEFVN